MKKEIRTYLKLFVACSLVVMFFTSMGVREKIHTPEGYVKTVQEYFSNEQWEDGKKLLDEALKTYPTASNLQELMGKYWYHRKDYDKSRYHLVKAVEDNYNNVTAKSLLVDVEEETKNYSSAICYVNELLEVNPYWRGLWRRKIELFRKQGNDVEADRLLKRINQIYPNDTILKKDYIFTMEENFVKQKRGGDKKEAIKTLEELIKNNPKNEEYYLDIINLYLQDGNQDQALLYASNGIAMLPGSMALINKKVSILADLSRHLEALAYLRTCMKTPGSPAGLRNLYNNLLMEAARTEKQKDPYVLYGIAYNQGNKTKETLDYLVGAAVNKGYTDDALFYIAEAKKKFGSDKSTLYKEYQLYLRNGDKSRANSLLKELYENYPGDYDIELAMCDYHMKSADKLIGQGLYSEALPHVKFVTAKKQVDAEMYESAWEKTMACYVNMKPYNEALATIDTLVLLTSQPENYIGKKAFVLDKMGRTREALNLYLSAIENTGDVELRNFYIIGYEDLAVPYIKKCIEMGASGRAYETSCELLKLNPTNDLGLRYAINTSNVLKKDKEFRQYTEQGYTYYPDELFYIIKKASVYNKDKEYQESVGLLRPQLNEYPNNDELVGAYAESSEYLALRLSKNRQPEEALSVIDTALWFNPENKSLKYTKGLIYEQNKQYDSAYYYQSMFEPTFSQYRSFSRQLTGLKNKTYKNEIGLAYLQSRYGDEDVISSIATLEYTRRANKNVYTGRVNYAGRTGMLDEETGYLSGDGGGMGYQLQAEWTHKFSSRWETMANLAWADRYFPKVTANFSLTRFLKNDWELDLRAGYRRLADSDNLYSFGPGVSKTWSDVWINGKLDLFYLKSRIYYNVIAQGRFFPIEDGKTHIAVMAGVGSAPELSIIDYALTGSFSHVNVMTGLGGQCLLTDRIALGLLGTWYTYYNQKIQGSNANGEPIIKTQYKNLYNIYAQVYISF